MKCLAKTNEHVSRRVMQKREREEKRRVRGEATALKEKLRLTRENAAVLLTISRQVAGFARTLAEATNADKREKRLNELRDLEKMLREDGDEEKAKMARRQMYDLLLSPAASSGMPIHGGMGVTEGEKGGCGGSNGGEGIDDGSDDADMDVDGDVDLEIDEGVIASGDVTGGQALPPCEEAGGTLVAGDGGRGGAGEGVMAHAGAVAAGAISVGSAVGGMVGGDQGRMAAGGTDASAANDVAQAARGQLEGSGQGVLIVPGAAARYYANGPAASRPAVDNPDAVLVERDGGGAEGRAKGAAAAAGSSAAAGVPVAATEGVVGTAAQNVGTVVSMAGSGGGGGG